MHEDDSMKVVLAPKYGKPSDLEHDNVAKPVPLDDEVLIKVYAASVNRTDTHTLAGTPKFARLVTGCCKPKYEILGCQYAGKIEAIGEKVTRFSVGDNVFGMDDSFKFSGAYAEYIVRPGDHPRVLSMPSSLTYAEAASAVEGLYYAQNFISKVDVQKGDKIFVNGGTGAIGSACIQLLKYHGAIVTATCQGQHMDVVKSLGADKVIDYTKEDFTQTDEAFKYVFDCVGKSSFSKTRRMLSRGGIYISSELGSHGSNIFLEIFTPCLGLCLGKKKVVGPLPKDLEGCIALAKKLADEGKFKPLMDEEYDIEDIKEAFEYVGSGKKVGNVSLIVCKTDDNAASKQPSEINVEIQEGAPEKAKEIESSN